MSVTWVLCELSSKGHRTTFREFRDRAGGDCLVAMLLRMTQKGITGHCERGVAISTVRFLKCGSSLEVRRRWQRNDLPW